MSYDLRIGVKVEGAKDLYVVIDEPELSSPTYNLRDMFVACMGWDYKQGEWYNVSDVLPKIKRGIAELQEHPSKYRKYNAQNGWGTVENAGGVDNHYYLSPEKAAKAWNRRADNGTR